MDFEEILAKADSNARKNSKKLRQVDHELQLEKQKNLERLAVQKQIEKADLKRRLPPKPTPPPEPKFVIPKKKETQTVDKKKLAAFLQRQEMEKQEKLIQKQKEKEELIRLRIEASGGKVNKKIAKHFGETPLNLQRRYAHNPEHEELLIRQEEREQEEHDKLSALYRQGVYRALNKKDEVVASHMKKPVKSSATPVRQVNPEQHHTSKATSSSSAKPSTSSKTNHHKILSEPKKRRAGEPVEDFKTLMEKAQMNRNIDPEALFEFKAPANRPAPKKPRPSVDGVGVSAGLDLKYASKRSARDISPEYTAKPSKSVRKEPPLDGDYPKKPKLTKQSVYDDRRESTKCNVPPSKAAAAPSKVTKAVVHPEMGYIKEKRYLPSDIRAKQMTNGASSQPTSQKRYLPGDIRASQQPQRGMASGPSKSSQQRSMQPTAGSSRQMSETRPTTGDKRPAMKSGGRPSNGSRYEAEEEDIESALARKRRELEEMERVYNQRQRANARDEERERRLKQERMRHEMPRYNNSRMERKRSRSPAIRYANYSETDEDEEEEDGDEYDSDMADFIDDSIMDNMQREDFEESLRMINPRYDKKKWMMREKMISDRHMDARFHDVETEERYSARVGMYEDMAEARRGSKALG